VNKELASMILSDKEEILKVIETFFDVGRTKNFSALREIQLDSPEFSSLSDVPPYSLKNYSDSIALEELRFSSISDYEYKIIDPITSIFGNIAIAKFRLMQKGMLVDNKAFTGTHITINGRTGKGTKRKHNL